MGYRRAELLRTPLLDLVHPEDRGRTRTELERQVTGKASGALVDCGIGSAPCAGAAGKVCLIERGTNSFSDNVLNCQAGGGAAAIIYDNTSGQLLGTLGDVATSIPSVGITQAEGQALLTQTGASTTVSAAAGNYAKFDGTSMATPHVSAVAALVWSH